MKQKRIMALDKNLKVSVGIVIDSDSEKVWRALTDPDMIKIYLYGTETITDWQVGSSIIFQGEYEGHKYKDKGNVLKNVKNELLCYNYWSGFSGLSDSLENYAIVTYSIQNLSQNQVKLTWTQEGYANEEGHKHSESGLPALLQNIKELVENS